MHNQPEGSQTEKTLEAMVTADCCHSKEGIVSNGEQTKIWGSRIPTTESIVPPSYYRSKAKNDTCFIMTSAQGIL